MQSIYVVGGHISDESDSKGNVFTVPSNKYAEFNMFLDPLAAKTVLESTLGIILIPLSSQSKAASFLAILQALKHANQTPESFFVLHLFLLLHDLHQKHHLYHHMVNNCFFYLTLTITCHQKKKLL
jgi:inosine-uridine nucleoside N-ribohydrolase